MKSIKKSPAPSPIETIIKDHPLPWKTEINGYDGFIAKIVDANDNGIALVFFEKNSQKQKTLAEFICSSINTCVEHLLPN